MKNLPKKIYLQVDEYAADADNFNDLAEVTWCKDRINKTDIVYYLKPAKRKIPSDDEIRKQADIKYKNWYEKHNELRMRNSFQAGAMWLKNLLKV